MAERHIEFDFSELNWSQVDVSPDGKLVLFDALGDLYTVPIGGGEAKLLRGGQSWDAHPRYSPDGKMIAFSARTGSNGAFGIRVMAADGGDAALLTSDPYQLRHPEWSGDGKSILASKSPLGSGDGYLPNKAETLHGIRDVKLIVDGQSYKERTKLVEDGLRAEFYSMAPRSDNIYYMSGRKFFKHDSVTGQVTSLNIHIEVGEPIYKEILWTNPVSEAVTYPDAEMVAGLRVSPDERFLILLVTKGEKLKIVHHDLVKQNSRDVLSYDEASELFDLPNRRQSLNSTMVVAPGFAITPNNREIVIVAGGSIVRIDVETGATSRIPFVATFSQVAPDIARTMLPFEDGPARVKIIRWPSISKDMKLISFTALGKVWLHDIDRNRTRRVTDSNDMELAPAISPDGQKIAYVDWRDDGSGHVVVVGTDTDARPSRLPHPSGFYMNPTWSPDGKKIAYIKAYKADYRDHVIDYKKRSLMIFDIASGTEDAVVGEFEFVRHFAERENAPLVFSDDGTRIYWTDNSSGAESYGSIWVNSVDIETRKKQKHLRIEGDAIDHVMVSPNGHGVAISASTGIWAIPLDDASSTEQKIAELTNNSLYKKVPDLSLVPGARHVTSRVTPYMAWNGNDEIVWSLGATVYRTNLSAANSQISDGLTSEVVSRIDLEFPRNKAKGVIAYTNARILTMGERGVIDDGTIIVEDGIIIAIDTAKRIPIPSKAKIMPLAGKTIIPGMIDTHAHPGRRLDEYSAAQNSDLISNLAFGVTTLFEVSGAAVPRLAEAEMIESGAAIGSRLLSVGGGVFGSRFDSSDVDAMHQLVADKKAMGAWGLKSYGLGMEGVRRALLEAARKQGLAVVAHANETDGPELRPLLALEGTTALEHSSEVHPISEDWIKLFAATGVHLTPTLPAEGHGISGMFVSSDLAEDAKVRRYLGAYSRDYTLKEGAQEIEEGALGRRFVKTLYSGLLNVLRAGGHVSMGLHGKLNGPDAHLVLESLVLNGFTPLEALATLTSEPAHKLGLKDVLGSLDVGHVADFVVLNSNPLQDIRSSLDIQYVVKDGLVYDDESMTQLWPEYKPYDGPFKGDIENYPASRPIRLNCAGSSSLRLC